MWLCILISVVFLIIFIWKIFIFIEGLAIAVVGLAIYGLIVLISQMYKLIILIHNSKKQ